MPLQPFLVTHEHWGKGAGLENGEQEGEDPASSVAGWGMHHRECIEEQVCLEKSQTSPCAELWEGTHPSFFGGALQRLAWLHREGGPSSSWLGLAEHPQGVSKAWEGAAVISAVWSEWVTAGWILQEYLDNCGSDNRTGSYQSSIKSKNRRQWISSFFHVADSREHLWYLRHRVDHLVTEMNQAKAKTFVDLSV